MKTLSTWLASAGLFFMSAGHSLAATCPPGMPSVAETQEHFAKVASENGAKYVTVVKPGSQPNSEVVALIVKEGSKFGASISLFSNGCRLPVPSLALDPKLVAERIFGSTLEALFAEET